jgi:hypothetical protein
MLIRNPDGFIRDPDALGLVTRIERLLGWPEQEIEWHGNVGIGRDHGDTP